MIWLLAGGLLSASLLINLILAFRLIIMYHNVLRLEEVNDFYFQQLTKDSRP